MSFILDALRKSEADRQQQTGAEFSDVPSSSGEAQSFRWLWILAVILLVNLAVLLGILFRPEPAAVPPAAVEQPVPEQEEIAPSEATSNDSHTTSESTSLLTSGESYPVMP